MKVDQYSDEKLKGKGSLNEYICVKVTENFSKEKRIHWVSPLDFELV